MDGPVSDKTPDFVKALDIDHASDGEVMLAYGMNGDDLPLLNGFPLRLVVPGYYGTYWVKHLNEIAVIDNVFDGFWMKSAYRIPDTPNNSVEPGTAPKATIPINRFTVRSFVTNVTDGATLKPGNTTLKGIAFDGGKGIKEVAVSIDGGKTWMPARLGRDLGKYSFREWKLRVKLAAGTHELKVRATNNAGDVQPMTPLWNPAGYSDPAYDKKMDDVYREPDEAKRQAMLKEMTREILDKAPYVWMPIPYIYTAWWPWVKNYGGELRAGAVRPGPIYARIWVDQEMKKKMGH